jgi:hypothetical protein
MFCFVFVLFEKNKSRCFFAGAGGGKGGCCMKNGVREFNELFVPMGGETSLEKFADFFPSFAISTKTNPSPRDEEKIKIIASDWLKKN